MAATPLVETYEKLKELRRKGEDVSSILDSMGGEFRILRVHLDWVLAYLGEHSSEALLRTIEIKALAERVFADPAKADAWLKRSTSALSGQRPIDLLTDELGAAVVREMLERIDHGIFA